jgi:hypothetical protein
MAVDGKALATSLGINGGVCVAFVIAFCFLRAHRATRRFYAPKRSEGSSGKGALSGFQISGHYTLNPDIQ